jgi:undecaprenyl-diphosphatase
MIYAALARESLFRPPATHFMVAPAQTRRCCALDLLNLLRAAVLGILQGLTEFLPVSSTGHLLIFGRAIGYDDPGGVFTVMIQLGSILAVMWLYRQRIWEVVTGLPTKPEARRFAIMLFLAFLPAAFVGLIANSYVRGELYLRLDIIAMALILGGVAMLAIEKWPPKVEVKDAALTPVWRAVGVGAFQTLALIPGVSRSGATIFGGLALGLDRRAAAEFSFFLAMPTMMAAFVFDLVQMVRVMSDPALAQATLRFTPAFAIEVAVGFVFAFISAALVVKPFLEFITRVGFGPFAWYRIVFGAVILGVLALGWL